MSHPERMKVLEMLERGDIDAKDATKLLALLGSPAGPPPGGADPGLRQRGRSPRFLVVSVEPTEEAAAEDKQDRVNVRVPIAILKAGVKLSSLIPVQAAENMEKSMSEHGIDFDLKNLDQKSMDELIDALADLEVDVRSDEQQIRIHTE